MKADEFLKKYMNYSYRDLEYTQRIDYWKVVEIMEAYHKKQLNLPDVVKSSTCDVCFKETTNAKDEENYRYCDDCNEY